MEVPKAKLLDAVPKEWSIDQVDLEVDVTMQAMCYLEPKSSANVTTMEWRQHDRWKTCLINHRSRVMKKLQIRWNTTLVIAAVIQALGTIAIAALTYVLAVDP